MSKSRANKQNRINTVTVSEDCEGELYTKWYKCSGCGCEYIIDIFKYCPECGKRINWENNITT